jgi:peptidoglycan/LPS O-acetylase OafA/YrhL
MAGEESATRRDWRSIDWFGGLRLLSREPSGIQARFRDNNFDALRLLFASLVVVFHMGLLSAVPSLAWTQYVSATFAVQAFFVVSGFLVTMSFERSSSLWSYSMKRIRRIVPAYVAVVICAAVLLVSMSTLPPARYFTSRGFLDYLGYNLALSNFRAPDLPGVFAANAVSAVNGSLWTIKVEVGFYLLVPLIVWSVRRLGYRRALGSLFILSLVWHAGFQLLHTYLGNEIYDKLAKQLPGQLSYFVGGAWTYYGARDNRSPHALAALAGAIVYPATAGLANVLLAPFAVTAMVMWAALAGPRLPALGKHGDFSYGVYVYHFPIVQTLIALGLFAVSPALAVIVSVILVAICSVASWYCIEAPALSGRGIHALAARQTLAS